MAVNPDMVCLLFWAPYLLQALCWNNHENHVFELELR